MVAYVHIEGGMESIPLPRFYGTEKERGPVRVRAFDSIASSRKCEIIFAFLLHAREF